MSQRAPALYSYEGSDESELSFQEGDWLTVHNSSDPDWWEAEVDGRRGWAPANYLGELQKAQGLPARPARPSAIPNNAHEEHKQGGTAAAGARAGGRRATVAVANSTVASQRIDTAAEAQSKPKESETKFGIWATNMALLTGLMGIIVGIGLIDWTLADEDYHGKYPGWTGFYSLGISVLVLAYELKWAPTRRAANRMPTRALAYAAASLFLFWIYPSMIVGVPLLVVAMINATATYYSEEYDPAKPPQRKVRKAANSGQKPAGADANDAPRTLANLSMLAGLQRFRDRMRDRNSFGSMVFLCIYVLVNIILFFYQLDKWRTLNSKLPVSLSHWGPMAKSFGILLDFNCSLLVVPVLRTIIRMLYNVSTSTQSWYARLLRLLLFFPLDRSLAFHKLVAKVVVFASLGHTVCHFLNYGMAPDVTLATFGTWPWISGGMILLIMLLMYSAARPNIRNTQFEIFWYVHHLFVGFYLLLLSHGKGGWNKVFWQWFVGPGVLYLCERLLRVWRANQPVVLLSVTDMTPNVFSLEISKEGVFASPYLEGQYVFVQAPAISRIQWHPFTISSAPAERAVTLHIRALGPGSWTYQLREYLRVLGSSKAHFKLSRAGQNRRLAGAIVGPDGKTLLRLDGPHSAPTQHMSRYSTAMIVGAGIGVTPVASSLKSIVCFRWKYHAGRTYPDNAFFYWVCPYRDIPAFKWLIRTIKDVQDEVEHLRRTSPESMASKHFRVHIFITSLPKDAKPIEAPPAANEEDPASMERDLQFWGQHVEREEQGIRKAQAGWTEADLLRVMSAPQQPHTVLGDVEVWEGRPNWRAHFAAVAEHQAMVTAERSMSDADTDVGVAFCGNPFIAKDLSTACQEASHGSPFVFKFHKENF